MTWSFNNNNSVYKKPAYLSNLSQRKKSALVCNEFIVSVALSNTTSLEADGFVSELAGMWHRRHESRAKFEENYSVQAPVFSKKKILLKDKYVQPLKWKPSLPNTGGETLPGSPGGDATSPMGVLLPLITTASASHIRVGKLLVLPIQHKGIDSFAITSSALRESSSYLTYRY